MRQVRWRTGLAGRCSAGGTFDVRPSKSVRMVHPSPRQSTDGRSWNKIDGEKLDTWTAVRTMISHHEAQVRIGALARRLTEGTIWIGAARLHRRGRPCRVQVLHPARTLPAPRFYPPPWWTDRAWLLRSDGKIMASLHRRRAPLDGSTRPERRRTDAGRGLHSVVARHRS